MDREIRNLLERTTQQARRLLEAEYGRKIEGTFDILSDGTIHPEPGGHLTAEERFFRGRLVAAIEHRRALGESAQDSVANFLRECAFTFLNRIVALRMLEARGIIKPSVSKGEESSGFTNEFLLLAQGLKSLPDTGYRLYLESLFDEIGREVGVLFDRNDLAGQLWPDRPKLLELLELLNNRELESVWAADETIGWVYQYFNSDDERRQMRADSAAPRNSREMAVRNQFFTPRYVVEFLTDNTLGRTWYEMRQGQTALRERCRYMVRRPDEKFLQPGQTPPPGEALGDRTQEELLRETVFVPYRAPKDPRTIRVLDPACGSGHFLLYCFDLLELIYEEAWDSGVGTVRNDYPDKAELKHVVPELILRHNLHGIDIDPRAAQIGSLALWMRAQRSWQAVPRPDRPQIRKTNIVIAEPMPGEADLLEDFCEGLDSKLLGKLVREVFDRMRIAGDAGALLRIETDIVEIVAEARREWLAEEAPTDRSGNPLLFAKSRQRNIFEMERVTADFWAYAELQVLEALHRFAAAAANGSGFRRRLFAEDAERGFAFIDLCRNRFDVMLMNPPFGAASLPSKDYVDQSYGDTKGDVYKAFVEGAYDRLVPAGMLGIISSRMGFFLSQSQDWRQRVVLRLFRPFALADLGEGVLDAMVETAAYVLRRIDEGQELNLTLELAPTLRSMRDAGEETFSIPAYSRKRGGLKRHQALQEIAWLEEAKLVREIPGGVRRFEILRGTVNGVVEVTAVEPPPLTCIQLIRVPDKEGRLRDSLHRLAFGRVLSKELFIAQQASFLTVPGAPFAYWVDNSIRGLFQKFPPFEGSDRSAKVGLQTSDDFRFVRAWWEVPVETLLTGQPTNAPEHFSRRTNEGKWWVPFAKGGKYSPYYADIHLVLNWNHEGHELKAWAGSLYNNSHWTRIIKNVDAYFRPGLTWPLRSQRGFSLRPFPKGAAFGHKGPVASCEAESLPILLGIANSSVFHTLLSLQMAFGSYEVGVFQRTPTPALHDQRIAFEAKNITELKRLQDSTQELSHVFRLPALLLSTGGPVSERLADLESRRRKFETEIVVRQARVDALSASLYGLPSPPEERVGEDSVSAPDADEDEDAESTPEAVPELIVYAVGCCFGRWDVRFATGERQFGCLPGLFDPLPVRAPGSTDGLEPGIGILADDAGHKEDLGAELESWFTGVFGESGHERMQEAVEILGGSGASLRDWLRAGLFEFHVKQYSKKPRKAPIYWQLSVPSRRYSIWLYYHRLSRDTFWRVLNDFVKPKLSQEERRLAGVRDEAGDAPSPSQRRVIQEQQAFVAELGNFKADIESIAPIWNPNLDDGVLLNFALLWKLVQQLPSWQRELSECWLKLCSGGYDWAHLAIHLWPERVVPKCATDRSLAIAHGLEKTFWEEQSDGKWKPKKVSPAEIRMLVDERSSKAVKAALEKLQSQSAGTLASRRGRSSARRNA
jgi:hypothetical protein